MGSRGMSLLVAVLLLLSLAPAEQALSAARDGAGMSDLFQAQTERLSPDAPYGAFVHFRQGTFSKAKDLLASSGLTVTKSFDTIGVVFATGTVADFLSLRDIEQVTYLEANKKLRYYDNTSVWATRVRVAQESVAGGPYLDPQGEVLNGSGIGVAIVDTGIDATHPDLREPVKANYKVVCVPPRIVAAQPEECSAPVVVQEAPNTDSSSGHGTHVAGIVAGDGTASEGTYKGAAPAAKIFGFGTGEVLSILTAGEALDYILERYETFTPRIRVINNSYGDDPGDLYDPESVYSKLVRALVAKGVVFTFAAGNAGGNGSTDATSSQCKDPTPGVICVANYDDGVHIQGNTSRCYSSIVQQGTACTLSEPIPGLASRVGALAAGSSRGKRGMPSTYPDISAPGTDISSTCLDAIQPVCASRLRGRVSTGGNRWQPWYATLTGTSMAAPHVAGAAALLAQARPQATPAEIEDVIKDSAHKFLEYEIVDRGGMFKEAVEVPYEPDPTNQGQTTSFGRGAGLLDMLKALQQWAVPGTEISSDGATPRRIITDGVEEANRIGAADVISVDVTEEDLGFKHKGFRYTVTLRDADDLPPASNGTGVMLQLVQMVDGYGMVFTTSIWVTRDHVQAVRRGGQLRYDNTAPAISVDRDVENNTVSFFVPYAHLGDPRRGTPIHNVHMNATVGPLMSPSIMEYAPGGVGPDAFLRPGFGEPYAVLKSPVEAADPVWRATGYRRPSRVERVRNTSAHWTSPPLLASVTPDGRYIAFHSESPDGVFVEDTTTGQQRLVSISSNGTPAFAKTSARPVISDDGRFVAFISRSGNLVAGDNNGIDDVFVHDRDSDADGKFDEPEAIATERVSVATDGTQAQAPAGLVGRLSITPNGRFVVFSSNSPKLVTGDINAQSDVFVHDRLNRTTEIVSLSNSGAPGEDASISFGVPSSISADGRYVSFFSEAQDLVAGDTNGANRDDQGFDVFVRDRRENKTVRVSVADDGSEIPSTVPAGALYSSLSSDGRFVAFVSEAWTLVPEDSNGGIDVFVHDRDFDEDGIFDEAGQIRTTRASVASDGSQANEQDLAVAYKRATSSAPALSGDGRFVAFESTATNLAPGDGNDEIDVFLHDRFTGTTERVSVASDGTETDQGSAAPVLSEGGRHVLFGNYTPPTTVTNAYNPYGGWERQIYHRDRGPTYGIGDVRATLSASGEQLDLSGWATFSGSRIAGDQDARSDVARPEVDLLAAEVIYRPESADLLAKLQLAEVPTHDYRVIGARSSATPGAIYAFGLTADGVRYEARATVPHGQFVEDAADVEARFELFKCDPLCDKSFDLRGSLGTTGDEAWIVIPNAALELPEGSEVTEVRAFTAAGASQLNVSTLDELTLPDAVIPEQRVSVGIVPAGAGADTVEFIDITDDLSEGKFSTTLDVANVSPGNYEVWARGCIADQCGDASRPVTLGAVTPTETPTSEPSTTPSASPTEVTPSTTALTFTPRSASAGQYSDVVTWEAQLATRSGEPIAGAEVNFALVGAELTQNFTAVTDDRGAAAVTEKLIGPPGAYQLTIRYAGDQAHSPSADVAGFVIEKEDSATALVIEGKGGHRTLVATLTDADHAATTVTGRSIEFFANDRSLGTVVTDDQGIARLPLEGKHKSGRYNFEAHFAGDRYYRRSFDRKASQ